MLLGRCIKTITKANSGWTGALAWVAGAWRRCCGSGDSTRPGERSHQPIPLSICPGALWQAFLSDVDVDGERRWADLPLKAERQLAEILCSQRLLIQGRGPFGEEFVTAGGVDLGEVNLATMESRRCTGLYLAGELLDVDGVTGGFNFQACWSGGWLAGQAIAADDSRKIATEFDRTR